MFDMMSRKVMIVSDFRHYPDPFPSLNLHCLIHPSYTSSEIDNMHTQDEQHDKVVCVWWFITT